MSTCAVFYSDEASNPVFRQSQIGTEAQVFLGAVFVAQADASKNNAGILRTSWFLQFLVIPRNEPAYHGGAPLKEKRCTTKQMIFCYGRVCEAKASPPQRELRHPGLAVTRTVRPMTTLSPPVTQTQRQLNSQTANKYDGSRGSEL